MLPDHRGTNVSAALHGYMVEYLTGDGCTRARLTVNQDNARAVAYYLKNGWTDAGWRREESGMRFMEIRFSAPPGAKLDARTEGPVG